MEGNGREIIQKERERKRTEKNLLFVSNFYRIFAALNFPHRLFCFSQGREREGRGGNGEDVTDWGRGDTEKDTNKNPDEVRERHTGISRDMERNQEP